MPLSPQPTQSERQPAAIHIRARDLRVGDRVVGEGKVERFKPYEDGTVDHFILSYDRANFHTHGIVGSTILLVEIDG